MAETITRRLASSVLISAPSNSSRRSSSAVVSKGSETATETVVSSRWRGSR